MATENANIWQIAMIEGPDGEFLSDMNDCQEFCLFLHLFEETKYEFYPGNEHLNYPINLNSPLIRIIELSDEQLNFWFDEGVEVDESDESVDFVDINDFIIPIEQVYEGRSNI